MEDNLSKVQETITEIQNKPTPEQTAAAGVSEVKVLTERLNAIENSNNMKLLIVDGIPEMDDAKTEEVFVNAIHNIITPPVRLGDIESAKRFGKPKTGGKPRSILVEFVYASIRRRTYLSRMQLAKARAPIYFGEYLTKEAAALFYEARQLTKRGPNQKLARSWTFNGQIFVSKGKTERGTLIKSPRELMEFIEKGSLTIKKDNMPMELS